jgi:hypothetical protein
MKLRKGGPNGSCVGENLRELNDRQLEQVIFGDYETIFSMKHKEEEDVVPPLNKERRQYGGY